MSEARAAVDRSFEELYRGHRADVFRAALRELGNVHDAEDVTQSAFVDAYRAVLRGSEPEVPRAWLLAIAENVRRRRYRSAQRRPREEPIDADFPLAAELSHELAHALAEALAALPTEQRQVFVLRELSGLSYEEIARETGSTVGAIQMLLFRARRSLRERLDPPAVGRRRAGLLVPLPGWLTALASRVELAAVTPRAAGAVGATAAAIAVGAGVAVTEVQADGAPSPIVEQTPPVLAVAPPAARASAPARRVTPVTSARSAPNLAAVVDRAAGADRPSTPASAAAPTPTVATAATAQESPLETRPQQDAPELPLLPAVVSDEEVEELLELPAAPVSTAPVLDAAAGAVGAAGADAPPLPVPDVPLPVLPPAP